MEIGMDRIVLMHMCVPGLAPAVSGGGAALAQSCAILSAADVQKVAGAHVTAVAFMSKQGAGGKCGN